MSERPGSRREPEDGTRRQSLEVSTIINHRRSATCAAFWNPTDQDTCSVCPEGLEHRLSKSRVLTAFECPADAVRANDQAVIVVS